MALSIDVPVLLVLSCEWFVSLWLVSYYLDCLCRSDSDLIGVLEPSPFRVDPLCKLSHICGGKMLRLVIVLPLS
jgi:hypothetical protein